MCRHELYWRLIDIDAVVKLLYEVDWGGRTESEVLQAPVVQKVIALLLASDPPPDWNRRLP